MYVGPAMSVLPSIIFAVFHVAALYEIAGVAAGNTLN